MILIEVSNGEIVDKLTILEIKKNNIQDKNKLSNIIKEYDYFCKILKSINIDKNSEYYINLYNINKELWDVEETIRVFEKNKQFNDMFIELARKVYFLNDKRAELKKQINVETKSNFIEEKSYEQ